MHRDAEHFQKAESLFHALGQRIRRRGQRHNRGANDEVDKPERHEPGEHQPLFRDFNELPLPEHFAVR